MDDDDDHDDEMLKYVIELSTREACGIQASQPRYNFYVKFQALPPNSLCYK